MRVSAAPWALKVLAIFSKSSEERSSSLVAISGLFCDEIEAPKGLTVGAFFWGGAGFSFFALVAGSSLIWNKKSKFCSFSLISVALTF